MSQEETDVFSQGSSQTNLTPTDHQRKFANLPLPIFRHYTNVRELVVEKIKQRNKNPLEIVIKKTIEQYHARPLDEWDDIVLNRLEFIGWPEHDKIDARIWSRSKRTQRRTFDGATEHQQQFLCLPLHVFKEATNIQSLVAVAARQRGFTLDQFVRHIHDTLPKINEWLPELNDLKFVDDIDPDTSKPRCESSASPKRAMRKRKMNISYTEDLKRPENADDDTKPKPSKRIRIRSETEELKKPGVGMGYKKSRIPLAEKNRSAQIVSYAPDDLQQAVQTMSFEEFASKTNIKEIIQKEYRERMMDENANIPIGEMNSRLLYYCDLRARTRDWHQSGLKHLKLIGSGSDQKFLTPDKSGEAPAEPTNETVTRDKLDSSNSKSAKVQDDSFEPTDFQKQVIAMDFETFVNSTNVKDLVIQLFGKEFEGSKEITEEYMNFGLKRYNSLRKRPEKWHKNLLKFLQIKPVICECRQNKTFEDKSTQTDPVETQDDDAQCHSLDLDGNKTIESENVEQPQQILQTKMANLTTHVIVESTIICIQHISMTAESDEVDPNITDDISMAEPENIDLMTFDDAPNLSLEEHQNHLSKRIEELVETSLRETLETLENENDDILMNEEPKRQCGNNLDSPCDEKNEELVKDVDLLEKSAETSSNEIIPHSEVEGTKRKSLEMAEVEVELSDQDIEKPQSQSNTSIAVVSTSLPTEGDQLIQTETLTENPIEAQTIPTIGPNDSSMDGFDPQRNSTAVGLSMDEASTSEVSQELEKHTCGQMPIRSDAEKTQSKSLQLASFSEQEKSLTLPLAEPQQMTPKPGAIEESSLGSEQIFKVPFKTQAILKNVNVAATSGNKTKAKVQKAYDQKENEPPKTQQQPQSQAQQAAVPAAIVDANSMADDLFEDVHAKFPQVNQNPDLYRGFAQMLANIFDIDNSG